MSTFVQCISQGIRQRWITAIRTNPEFQAIELCPNYSLPQWRNDRRVNRDERALFRSFLTASPYLSRVEGEVRIHDVVAEGLSSCLVTDSLSLSWDSESLWAQPEIVSQVLQLDRDGEISSTDIRIRNVSRVEHWNMHAEWFRSALASRIRSGPNLLEYAADLFPHLTFGSAAARQISSLTGNEPYFKWVIESLRSAELEVSGTANVTVRPIPWRAGLR